MAVNPVDKWIVSIFIPFGLSSSAIYFLRMLNPRDAIGPGGLRRGEILTHVWNGGLFSQWA